MKRLVTLNCNCHVNPDDVQEITVGDTSQQIVVRMRDGIGHHVEPTYGKGVYATVDKLKADIEAALSDD